MASLGELKNQLLYEADSLHTVAEGLCGLLKHFRADYVATLERRVGELERECDALRARLEAAEGDAAARFEQAKIESVQLARMWEAEKRRLIEENQILSEDLARARRAADSESGANGKLRMELQACAEELRCSDMRDAALAAAEADRDSVIAEAASLRRELGLLRHRFERAEMRPPPPPCHRPHFHDTVETTHVHMRAGP